MPWLKPPTRSLGAVAERDDLEHLVDALLAHRAGHAAQQAQVPARAHERVEGGVVDEAADVAQRALQLAGHAVAADLGVAARRVDEAQDQPDDRRLAGAVGAEKAEDVAPADLHVEAVDGAQAAELLGEGVRGQDGGAAAAALLLGPRPLRFTQLCASATSCVTPPLHVSERSSRRPRDRSWAPCRRPRASCRPAARRHAAERRADHRAALAPSTVVVSTTRAGSCLSCFSSSGVVCVCASDDGAEALAVEQHGGGAGRCGAVARRVRATRHRREVHAGAAPSVCMSGAPDPVSGPAVLEHVGPVERPRGVVARRGELVGDQLWRLVAREQSAGRPAAPLPSGPSWARRLRGLRRLHLLGLGLEGVAIDRLRGHLGAGRRREGERRRVDGVVARRCRSRTAAPARSPPLANTSSCSGTMVLPSMAAWTEPRAVSVATGVMRSR